MILRRIKAHVAKEDWFAVFIDFIIVVFGVYMGLQVSNWNETRGERQQEVQILQNIATDLRADINGYANSIDVTLAKIAAIKFILDNATITTGANLMDDTEINGFKYADIVEMYFQEDAKNFEERTEILRDKLWSYSVLVSNAQPSTTAFDSLVSAGKLGIIQNETLVHKLQQYRQQTVALEKAQEVTFRPRRDNAIDIGLEHGLSPFRGSDKNELLRLVSTHPKLAATVQTQLGWAQGHLTMLGGSDSNAQILLSLIENELGIAHDNEEAPK